MRKNELKGRAERRHIRVAAGLGSLLALSAAALLCGRAPALAQRTHPAQHRAHAGRGPALVTGQLPEKGTETMGQASDARLKFENPGDAPLVIREVKVRRAGGADANGAATISVTVANTTDRRITSFGLVFVKKSKERAYTERSEA
ncbi:MAG TPA: hypothetical protein VF508_03670, partial [Pyrinomonadaceae bacterium]